MERVVTGLIRGYQLAVSPLFPASCRFYPSCSQYALEAVKIHGTLKGSALSIRRICRCNPWNDGGIDLVPPAKPRSRSKADPTNQRPQS
ncbi:MAG: membrane protein insertion efficiency factor YidD [Limnobacter sp.]|nr:membrane protein insertion efficiency factor YidD [Limnobacter sp.]